MKINSSYILLKEIRCYAYHGVAPQENLIGNEYLIDLKLKVDISKAAQTDEVTDTVNYAEVHQVIEMKWLFPQNCWNTLADGLYKNSLTNSLALKKSNSGFPNETHRWEQI